MTFRHLYAWLGNRDLQAVMQRYPKLRPDIQKYIAINSIRTDDQGRPSPLRQAMEKYRCDQLTILMDFRSEELMNQFDATARKEALWVRYAETFEPRRILAFPVVLPDSKDIAEVYRQCKTVLERDWSDTTENYFLLSSGTAAMCSAWILLGKTIFNGAHFLQSRNDAIDEIEVPFSIYTDFLLKENRVLDAIAMEQLDLGVDGKCEAILKVKRQLLKVAPADVNVWVTGETGTGKERFARAIHDLSSRKDKPFVAINCAALTETLLEDELFGHVKGAYTGADAPKNGAFAQADGGTLFLDEIADCSPKMQASLLRVLQPPPGKPVTTRVVRPLGAAKDLVCNVRIIVATHKDLNELAQENQFRADLLERIAPITIRVPALRERSPDDRLDLAEKLRNSIIREVSTNRQMSRQCRYKHFSPHAMTFIMAYSWPRNVRQLQNAIWRGLLMADGERIEVEDLGFSKEDLKPAATTHAEKTTEDIPDQPVNLAQILNDTERRYLVAALEKFPNSKAKAAKWLGLNSYQAFDIKRKKYHL